MDADRRQSTMNTNATGQPVRIVMIEDDEGHARLIERNIRRAGVNNEVVHFTSGTAALDYLLDASTTPSALLMPPCFSWMLLGQVMPN